LEEQFSRLDATAAAIAAVRTKADQFRRSLLHAAFTGALTHKGARRMTDACLPRGWESKTLAEVCGSSRDAVVDGPFGSNLKRSDFVESGRPVLKIQNVKPNQILLKNMDFVSEEKFLSLARHTYRDNDIIMTKLGDPLGVSAIVDGLGPGVIVADLIRIRPKEINTRFLCYQLNSPSVSQLMNNSQKGTTRPRVNISMVRQILVAVPPPDEQEEIVRLLDEQSSRLERGLAVADEVERKVGALRRSLLHAAFSGQLTKVWREKSNV
jgi:type I restriction enzyme S subunit